jgi:hypothetical protein
MPRRALLLACLLTVVGCQTTTKPTASRVMSMPQPCACPASQVAVDAEGREAEAVTAAALVFDPPVVQDESRLDLNRAGREPRVAIGYDGPVTERYYIRTDDRQVTDGLRGHGGRGGSGVGGGVYDRFERRAVTERVGVRYR